LTSQSTQYKQQAAERAVEYLRSGQVIGLGEGSTVIFAARRIAQLLHTAQLVDFFCIPASVRMAHELKLLGIPTTTLEEHSEIALTIDGADEVDPKLNLIKGGGGALLREKIIAQVSLREIIVVDSSKLSPALGSHWSLPVEVAPFGWQSQVNFLKSLGAEVSLRQDSAGVPFTTDQDNLILDCNFGLIERPQDLAVQLDSRAGIVEHGLFLGLASEVIVAGRDGIHHLNKSNA
jgi:ribose 5-phosphate isomerase A